MISECGAVGAGETEILRDQPSANLSTTNLMWPKLEPNLDRCPGRMYCPLTRKKTMTLAVRKQVSAEL
jgi:hypothetical protein